MAYLTVRIKGEEGYRRVLLDKEQVVVGRSSSCEVTVRHISVSRQHCRLARDAEGWWLEDLGSHNGTKLGQEPVSGRVRLREGDIIRIGAARLTFHEHEPPAVEAPPAADGAARSPDDLAERCGACGQWVSVAHLAPGEAQPCPRCGAGIPRPAA